MYKNAAISELLYYTALRMKGGIDIRKPWSKRYRERLESILSFMEQSVRLIAEKRDLTKSDILLIVGFINENAGTLFPAENIDISSFCDEGGKLVLTNNNDWDDSDEKIVELMLGIISEAKECLRTRPKGYKRRISRLFHDFHNLPRAYLSRVYSPDRRTTFLGRDYSRSAVSKSQALEFYRL